MANLPWLDEVLKRLVDQALPPAYIKRLMGELSDHFQDVTEETMSTEADAYSRLGKPEQVADAAIAAYRDRSFLGRHPTAEFLFFVISPVVPLFGLGFVACALLARVCAAISASIAGQEVGTAVTMAWASFFGLLILCCSILATLLYCQLAEGSCASRRWMAVSWAALAVWAALWQYGLRSDMGQHATWFLSVALPVQFIVPLAVGWWFGRRHSRQSYPVTTFFALAVTPVVALAVMLSIDFLGLNLLLTKYGTLAGPLGISIDGHNWHAQTTIGTSLLVFVFLMVGVGPSGLLSLLYCTWPNGSTSAENGHLYHAWHWRSWRFYQVTTKGSCAPLTNPTWAALNNSSSSSFPWSLAGGSCGAFIITVGCNWHRESFRR